MRQDQWISRYLKELGEVGNIEHLFGIPVNNLQFNGLRGNSKKAPNGATLSEPLVRPTASQRRCLF